jgi:hypothetical protein
MDLSKEKEAGWRWEPECTKVSVKRRKALGITITAFLDLLVKLGNEPIWRSSSLGRSALLLGVDIISSIISHIIVVSQPILHHLRVHVLSVVILW